eukprot:CAMPEP_0201958314 /NCGR_PEP_ID=MMETSP0904-20121228/5506_1 /ASSEMBLY_ACC=CAM_ASM_000553 /TAXON_ID=420261 /ORGANISM="Thalassiosira antarctica, Strain CCMP982" /LENGTH=51 /DNA_ID=CAMNT_0048503629 /DNA_START=709 /DNA_END=864 /DNA_ORIENTATION=-
MMNRTALHMKVIMGCGRDGVCLGRHGLSGLVQERIKRGGIKPASGRGPRLS